MYEVTSVDTGKTLTLTLEQCHEMFGEAEFEEILAGYLPHIIAVKIS